MSTTKLDQTISEPGRSCQRQRYFHTVVCSARPFYHSTMTTTGITRSTARTNMPRHKSEILKDLYGEFLQDEDYLLVSLENGAPIPLITNFTATPLSDNQGLFHFLVLGIMVLLLIPVTLALSSAVMQWPPTKEKETSCQLAEEAIHVSPTALLVKKLSEIENDDNDPNPKLDGPLTLDSPSPELVCEPSIHKRIYKSMIPVACKQASPSALPLGEHQKEMHAVDVTLEHMGLIDKTDSNSDVLSTTVSSSAAFDSKQFHSNLNQDIQIIRHAERAAENVLLNESVFAEHGLDYQTAVLFALQQQKAILEKETRDAEEKRRLEREVRHEQSKERRHREHIAVMNFEPDWQEKLELAYDNCFSGASRGSIISVTLTLAIKLCQKNANVLGGSDAMLDLVATMVCGCGTDVTQSTKGYHLTYAFLGIDSSTFFLSLCYLYCFVRCLCILCASVIMHRLSTAFLLPKPVHHTINLGVLLVICSPSRVSELNSKLLANTLLSLLLPHGVTFGVLVVAMVVVHNFRRHSMEKLGVSIDRSCVANTLAAYDSIYWVLFLAPIFIPFLHDRDVKEFFLEQLA